jgi:alpha-L-rhamnosidase
LIHCNGHLDTGLHGTYFMTKYLTEHQRSDLVFTYASQESYPGYGYLLAQGYQTWPERWEGDISQMHGCFNGIGGWFQRGLAGIRPVATKPGYKEILIRPSMVGDVSWVRAHHDSVYGRIVSCWKRENQIFTLELSIPSNTKATVYLPTVDAAAITESGKPAARQKGVRFVRLEAGAAIFQIGSGTYLFTSPIRPTAFLPPT